MEHYSSTEVSFDPQNSENDPVRSANYGRFPKERLIYGAILGYCILHCLIRIFTSPILTIDEAQFALLGQSFSLGYGTDHPPLLSWMFAGLKNTIGVNLYSIAILKYALMTLGLCAYYKSMLTIFEWMDFSGLLHRRLDLAAAATGSWALVFMVGWSNHEDQIPQVLDFTLLSISLFCLTKSLTSKGYAWWIAFGISVGLSLLSHLHLILFPLSLICAAMGMKSLTRPHYDANGDRLSPPAITWVHVGVTLAFTIAVFACHAMWLLQDGGPANSLNAADFGLGENVTFTTQEGIKDLVLSRGLALRALFFAMVEYIMPLGVIFLLLFWPMWFAFIYPFFPKREVDEGPFERTWRRLFSYTLRLSIAFLSIITIITGHTLVTIWMLPVFFALPIWLFFQVQRSGPYFIAMRALAAIILISIIIVPIARFIDWSEDIMSCTEARCHTYLPIDEFAQNLSMEGFANGTIIGADPHLTGNLRTQFPNARILDAHYHVSAFPAATGKGACLAVWRDEDAKMPNNLAKYLNEELGIQQIDKTPGGAIRKNLINSREKHSVLYFRFLKPNKNCR